MGMSADKELPVSVPSNKASLLSLCPSYLPSIGCASEESPGKILRGCPLLDFSTEELVVLLFFF